MIAAKSLSTAWDVVLATRSTAAKAENPSNSEVEVAPKRLPTGFLAQKPRHSEFLFQAAGKGFRIRGLSAIKGEREARKAKGMKGMKDEIAIKREVGTYVRMV